MKKRMLHYKPVVLIALMMVMLFTGCKKDKNNGLTVNYMYNYYPIDSGHYIIYNVDSVNFSYDQIYYHHDTTSYQMQAFFGDTIHDLLDSVNFRVYYSTRLNNVSPWNTPFGSYGLRTTTNLQTVENDIRFIKLIFPPTLAGAWNGNIYVGDLPGDPYDPYAVFQNWNYFYETVDTTVTIAGQTYNNVIVVSEVNNVNVITKTVRTEMYAPNVGMIYQEWEALSKQGGNIQLGWDTGATSGFSIHMWAVAHN